MTLPAKTPLANFGEALIAMQSEGATVATSDSDVRYRFQDGVLYQVTDQGQTPFDANTPFPVSLFGRTDFYVYTSTPQPTPYLPVPWDQAIADPSVILGIAYLRNSAWPDDWGLFSINLRTQQWGDTFDTELRRQLGGESTGFVLMEVVDGLPSSVLSAVVPTINWYNAMWEVVGSPYLSTFEVTSNMQLSNSALTQPSLTSQTSDAGEAQLVNINQGYSDVQPNMLLRVGSAARDIVSPNPRCLQTIFGLSGSRIDISESLLVNTSRVLIGFLTCEALPTPEQLSVFEFAGTLDGKGLFFTGLEVSANGIRAVNTNGVGSPILTVDEYVTSAAMNGGITTVGLSWATVESVTQVTCKVDNLGTGSIDSVTIPLHIGLGHSKLVPVIGYVADSASLSPGSVYSLRAALYFRDDGDVPFDYLTNGVVPYDWYAPQP